jgi:hypothetical protein
MGKVDPRTGVVVIRRRSTAPPSVKKRIEQPTISASTMDYDELKTLLENMMNEIRALAMKPPLASRAVLNVSEKLPSAAVSIDESVIDVGIGDQLSMDKGESSSTIAEESTEQDKSLSRAKSRLRALKGGK